MGRKWTVLDHVYSTDGGKPIRNRLFTVLLLACLAVPSIQTVRALEIERPDTSIPFVRTLNSTASTYATAVSLGVTLTNYVHDFYGKDIMVVNVSAAANTRRGIGYHAPQGYPMSDQFSWLTEGGSHSYQELTYAGSDGDDNGTWVLLPLPYGPPQGMWLRFYGADYKHVIDAQSGVVNSSIWISTNGFISFDPMNSTAKYADGIPSRTRPNAMIAPLWTDLKADEQSVISVRIPNDVNYRYFLVIIWKNILVKSNPGLRVSFTVALEGYSAAVDGTHMPQSRIYFAYNNVSNIDDGFTYGIEDHEGLKGAGQSFANGAGLGSLNNTVQYFAPQTTGDQFYVSHLKLTFSDNNIQDTEYDFYPQAFSGNNLLNVNLSAPDIAMEKAMSFLSAADGLIGLGSLLLSAEGTLCLLPWTLPIGVAFLALDLRDLFAQSQFNKTEIAPGWEICKQAPISYVNVTADNMVVDASVGAGFIWTFTDGYSARASHNITIGAVLEYTVYPGGSTYSVGTSVNVPVTPDVSTDWSTATRLPLGSYDTVQFYGIDRMPYIGSSSDTADYFLIRLKKSYNISISVFPEGDNGLSLYLYDPSLQNIKTQSTSNGGGQPACVQYFADSSGDWGVKIGYWSGHGFYNMSFRINLVGDITGNGGVDIFDAIKLANAFGTQPGSTRKWPYGWNPKADLNNNGCVDIYDAILLANSFGTYFGDTPPPNFLGGGFGKGMRATMDGTPSVFVDPSQITAFRNENFTVNVKVTSVTDLLGWEFKLFWDSAMLNCTSAVVQTPAEWQDNAQNYGSGLENGYNITHGRFWAAQSANYPAPSFNGSMAIATLTFQALQPGTTTLALIETKLGNSTADPIDHTESSGQVGVYFGRYMRSDTQQVNGLSANKLNIPQSTDSAVKTQSGSGMGALFGIRAWVRHSNGIEQEICLDGQTGTPQATVGGGSAGIRSNTVSVAQTALQATDSLVVRVYVQIAEGSWNLCTSFTTEQLQSSTLKATTWTVYYYTSSTYNRITDRTTASFYWGTTTYNSRIQNLQYT